MWRTSLCMIHQEYIFRHRSACTTLAESGQEYLTSGKEYTEPCKTQWDEGTKGKNRSLSRTGPAPSGWGNWSKGLILTSRQLSESEEKHLRLRVKQLIYGSLNGMRIRHSLPQAHIPWTGILVSWKAQQLGAGVKELWSNPRVRGAVGCGETDWGDVREEIMVGNTSGGKPSSHGKGVTAESSVGGGAITIASLPTCQNWQLNNREAGPSNTWHTKLQSRTPPRVLLSVTDAPELQSRIPARGAPLCAWFTEQQRRNPGKGAL